MPTESYNKQNIAPLQRKNLFDYFPVSYSAFPGYVRQEVFRLKLKEVLSLAMEASKWENGPTISSAPVRQMYYTNNWSATPHYSAKGGSYITSQGTSSPVEKQTTPIKHDEPYSKAMLRAKALQKVDTMEWRPPSAMKDYAAEYRTKSKEYLTAIGKDAIVNGIGKGIEKGVGAAAAQVSKITPKTKAGQATKWVAQQSMTTYEKKTSVKIMSKNIEVGLFSFNRAETVAGKGVDWTANKIIKAEGVDVSFNNDYNKAWLMNHGMSEGAADFVMTGGNLRDEKYRNALAAKIGMPPALAGFILHSVDAMIQTIPALSIVQHLGVARTLDVASDFVPIAATTRAAESIAFNLIMSVQSWNAARSFEETQRHFDKLWREFTTKLKAKIKQDINSLSDKELSDLCKLLEINQ